MPSLICSALIALAPMLMLFLTPGGVCLLLASPFWTVGMDIVFYFVENQYPGKVVAVVSAVVAILFVVIVLSISVILLWQEGRQGDEAVFTGHRVKDASVGKYGDEFTETRYNVNVAPFITRAFASVSGASPNHGNDEYGFLVGGSRSPSLVKPENCEPSADSSLDESCMPEVEVEACQKHVQVAVGTELVSLSSVVPRSAGVPDGTFVTSVAKVASMTGTVDASSVSGSCGAVVEPLGETLSSAFASFSGADDGVASALCRGSAGGVAITCGGNTEFGAVGGALDSSAGSAGAFVSGGTASNDANKGDSACVVSGALDSGISIGDVAAACLVGSTDSASFSAAIRGVKRMRDDEDASGVPDEHTKKQKVISPLCDGVPFALLKAQLEVAAIAATIAVNTALVRAGAYATSKLDTAAFCAGAFGAFSAFGAGTFGAGHSGASVASAASGSLGGCVTMDALIAPSAAQKLVCSASCTSGSSSDPALTCRYTAVKQRPVCVLSRLLPIAGRIVKQHSPSAKSRKLYRVGAKHAYQEYLCPLLRAGKVARAAAAARDSEIAARPKKAIVRRSGGVFSAGIVIPSAGIGPAPRINSDTVASASQNTTAAVPSVAVAVAAAITSTKKYTRPVARGRGISANSASAVPSVVAAKLPQNARGNPSNAGRGRGTTANLASVVPSVVAAAAAAKSPQNTRGSLSIASSGRGAIGSPVKSGARYSQKSNSSSSYHWLPKDTTQWNPNLSRGPWQAKKLS